MRKKRLYGLFRRPRGSKGRWERLLPEWSLPLDRARRAFQNRLIDMSLGGEWEPALRPVKTEETEV